MKGFLLSLISILAISYTAQAQTLSGSGFAVGQFTTTDAAATATVGYFSSDSAVGLGSLAGLDSDNSSTGIERTTLAAEGFSVSGNVISVSPAQAAQGIALVSLDGRTVYTGTATTIRADRGVYLLRIGRHAHKLLIQ